MYTRTAVLILCSPCTDLLVFNLYSVSTQAWGGATKQHLAVQPTAKNSRGRTLGKARTNSRQTIHKVPRGIHVRSAVKSKRVLGLHWPGNPKFDWSHQGGPQRWFWWPFGVVFSWWVSLVHTNPK